tara:strand:- start:1843 stop:2247 length:405 start_codon:yes stop_codon:yes gene_type:complete
MPKKKITKKSTAKKAESKKEPEIEFAHGKLNQSEFEEIEKVRRLTEIPAENSFGVRTEGEFEELIEGSQLTQLQEMAVKAGIFPSGTKPTLKNKLRKAFQKTKRPGPNVQATKPIVDPNSEKGKSIIKLMQENF